MPVIAPNSTAILHNVSLDSISRSVIADPVNSTAWPLAPLDPNFDIKCRTISFDVTPVGNFPSIFIRINFGFFLIRVFVAKACSHSVDPTPQANVPKAPRLQV